jgi:hypothetical protein
MRETRNSHKILAVNLIGRDYLGHRGIDVRIILKWIFSKLAVNMCIGLKWFSM